MIKEYCQSCGTLIEQNSDYCHKCGQMRLSVRRDIEIAKSKQEKLEKEKIEREIFKEEERKTYYSNTGAKIAAGIGIFLIFLVIFETIVPQMPSPPIFMIFFSLLNFIPFIDMKLNNNKISENRYVLYAIISLFGGAFILGFIPASYFFIASRTKYKI